MFPAACQKTRLYRSIGFLIRGRKDEQRKRGEFERITLIVCHVLEHDPEKREPVSGKVMLGKM